MTAWEPRPLETLTTTPAGALRSSGRKAWKVRTGPSTLTAKTSSTSAAVMSAMSANLPEIPALLTSTSREPPVAAATSSAARATLASSVTSMPT